MDDNILNLGLLIFGLVLVIILFLIWLIKYTFKQHVDKINAAGLMFSRMKVWRFLGITTVLISAVIYYFLKNGI